MATATKQAVYTGALTAIGHRKYLTSENTEAVRVLDDAYDQVLEECLEYGSWNFAQEFAKLDGDTGLITYVDTGSVGHGYRYGFTKPAGYVRTQMISDDEFFTYPLEDYDDRGPTLLVSEVNKIYLKYTDTGLGLDLSRWPAKFQRYVELELAARVAYRLTGSGEMLREVSKHRDKARREALNHDAMNEEPKRAPPGSWTRSRWGRYSNVERGNRSKLYG